MRNGGFEHPGRQVFIGLFIFGHEVDLHVPRHIRFGLRFLMKLLLGIEHIGQFGMVGFKLPGRKIEKRVVEPDDGFCASPVGIQQFRFRCPSSMSIRSAVQEPGLWVPFSVSKSCRCRDTIWSISPPRNR